MRKQHAVSNQPSDQPQAGTLRRLALATAGLLLASATSHVLADSHERDLHMYAQAIGLESNLEHGKQEYKVCVVCHTPEGWGTKDGKYPQIAGQLRGVIIKQLEDIRSRNRDNPTMFPFATGQMLDTPQKIADVAGYIAKLPMTTDVGHGSGDDLEHGKKMYEDHCAECHGKHGEGDNEDLVPSLYGQHYQYMVRQFEWIRDGKRRNADRKMVKQAKTFSERDLKAVMDYASRLPVPEEKRALPGWKNPDFPEYVRKPE